TTPRPSFCDIMPRPPPSPTLFPYTTLFRSRDAEGPGRQDLPIDRTREGEREGPERHERGHEARRARRGSVRRDGGGRPAGGDPRSEEHTSELHISYAVFCLKKKNKTIKTIE